ncbi:CS domain-containing protein [Scopulibacillus cellulosilyticus]|uniref:CS domain-containing protein n=1 Tax=Scopulibacillus cellulosilyticus TaxID=2665665 RepID=A0ABW2Q6R9_9BACL
MQQPFDEIIQKFFKQTNFPNPFDPEMFGKFLQEQIGNAIPNNLTSSGETGLEPTGKEKINQRNLNQHPLAKNFDRSNIPDISDLRKRRKGTTSGLGSPNAQSNQQSPAHQGQAEQELNYQAFETHDELILRVQIPSETNRHPKKMMLTNYQITFIGKEGSKPLLQIPLPKAVVPGETKLGFKKDLLEVKLFKISEEPVKEFDISHLLRQSDEDKGN